jgi:2-polyprenyl-3-methyl-5-hydroxy-6-metoxy-1,4-benzoquinol methylase
MSRDFEHLPSAYDELAQHYREYSARRAAYLNAVDKLIIQHMPSDAAALLDVGAGDGVRAFGIARTCNIQRVVLAEPNQSMARKCRQLNGVEVWEVNAQELSGADRQFNAVTCLWNVLGHVPDEAARSAAIIKMRALTLPGGMIFLDVNNRYNANAYGLVRTLFRAAYDLVQPGTTNGDVELRWEVAGRTITGSGHVFTPREMRRLFDAAELKIEQTFSIDYDTGAIRRYRFQGQLFYLLRA